MPNVHEITPLEIIGREERELRRLQLEAALDASAGAWQDADHPELADGPAIDRWIAEGRAQLGWDRSEDAS